MTYIGRGGKVWSMPFGGEYVAMDSDGVPWYFAGEGIAPMKLVSPRSLGKENQ